KFDVEKFTGKNDLGLWRIKMKALLVQQGLHEKEKIQVLQKAYSTIIISLGDKILRKVAKKDTVARVWLKLESLYM
ncbi:hypothetical protein I3842_14G118700, partial [Carya illinoinensis]